MNRRDFISSTIPAAALAATGTSIVSAQDTRPGAFKLKYAPHFGMFRQSAGDDLLEQLRFMRGEGFTALEDNGMRGRSVEAQEAIAKSMERLGMTMGVFVAHADFGKLFLGN